MTCREMSGNGAMTGMTVMLMEARPTRPGRPWELTACFAAGHGISATTTCAPPTGTMVVRTDRAPISDFVVSVDELEKSIAGVHPNIINLREKAAAAAKRVFRSTQSISLSLDVYC